MSAVICPFCLKPHDFQESQACAANSKLKVPSSYIDQYKTVPPLWLTTVGFTKHGKTTYLAALRLVLDHITRVGSWDDVYLRELDQFTQDAIRGWRRDDKMGKQVDETPEKLLRPLLLQIHGIPKYGSRGLVMYDLPGQIFDDFESVPDMAPAIRHASTTWFFVSLRDIEDDAKGRSLHELFQAYIGALEDMKVNLKGQNLIVVYTKGDKVGHQLIQDYLQPDPLRSLASGDSAEENLIFDIEEYERGMEEFSDNLEQYTRNSVRGGASFVNMVKHNEMNVVFTATAALPGGDNESGAALSEREPPRRLIDPFLWALKLQTTKRARSIVFIIDTSNTSAGLYEKRKTIGLWEAMERYGEVTTFYLGQSQPASGPGQAPPENQSSVKSPRLIMPILESEIISRESVFFLLCGADVLDLEDAADTKWVDNIYVARQADSTGEMRWPHGCVLNSDGNWPAIANHFLNTIKQNQSHE